MAESNFNFYSSINDEERNKSLQELDGQDWRNETSFSSHLIRTCHALRQKPLRDFTVEDLRIMIGQNINLDYLIPLALEHLQRDPLATGDFYEGDLLANVLRVESNFWLKRPDLQRSIKGIISSLKPFPEFLYQSLLIFQQT